MWILDYAGNYVISNKSVFDHNNVPIIKKNKHCSVLIVATVFKV